jgi:hypothetical protein
MYIKYKVQQFNSVNGPVEEFPRINVENIMELGFVLE